MVSVKAKEKIHWLLKHRKDFSFSGEAVTVGYDPNGADGVSAFYAYDTTGVKVATKHPNVLSALLTAKGSLNLNIKMWAQSRAEGSLPLCDFSRRLVKAKYGTPDKYLPNSDMETELDLPAYVVDAVEAQKFRYYGND